MIVEKNETITIAGGAVKFSASLVTAAYNACKFLYTVGQNLGSSIYRYVKGISC